MRYLYLFLTLVLVSCGTDSHHFKIDGRMLNLNQGEFYVYSPDGVIDGIDTIHVQAGRFSYEIRCEKKGTLAIIFPNFSEQPVFAEPGKMVSFEGDASKLKELTVKGTDDNKLMNRFREQAANASPQEIKHYVELIAKDNPQSLVPVYLINKYYMQSEIPDYKKALSLLSELQKAQPDNGRLKQLTAQVKNIASSTTNSKLPKFKAKDVDGKVLTEKDFSKGDAVIYVWASWEYESCNMQRTVREMKEKNPDLHALGICLDASVKECKRITERDNIELPIICDEKMLDGKLVQQLALYYLPDNILIKNGKIVARNLTTGELRKKLEQP